MKQKLPVVQLRKPVAIQAKGDSTWEKTEGTVLVDKAAVNYMGEKAPITPKSFMAKEFIPKGYKARQHVSLDVSGPKLLPFWYTDSGVEQGVSEAFTAGLLAATGADALEVSWSEQGMQEDAAWNFDVSLFWK